MTFTSLATTTSRRLSKLTKTTRLLALADGDLTQQLGQSIGELAISNAFNPSVARMDGRTFATIRGEQSPGERPFRSWLFELGSNAQMGPVDLTHMASTFGIQVVADPKLVKLGTGLFVTFNTGHTRGEPNGIYLQRVYPTLGPPQECRLTNRQPIEKNWAFYQDSDDRLRVLYGVQPFTTLSLCDGSIGESDSLTFCRDAAGGEASISQSFSIGTQLARIDADDSLLVVHQKHRVLGKRAYTGRLARVSFADRTVQLSDVRLIHSFKAALPRLKQHNPNLISATYFAGIDCDGSEVLLSYGINDRRFGIARAQLSDLATHAARFDLARQSDAPGGTE